MLKSKHCLRCSIVAVLFIGQGSGVLSGQRGAALHSDSALGWAGLGWAAQPGIENSPRSLYISEEVQPVVRTSHPRRCGDHLRQLLGLCRGCAHGIYDDREVSPVAAECHLGFGRCCVGERWRSVERHGRWSDHRITGSGGEALFLQVQRKRKWAVRMFSRGMTGR